MLVVVPMQTESAHLLDSAVRKNVAFRTSVARTADGWIGLPHIKSHIWPNTLRGFPNTQYTSFLKDASAEVAPTQHDVVTWLGLQTAAAGVSVEYLEVGVAVLKAFDTQVHAWRNASLFAYDIEPPNPTRATLWGYAETVASWRSVGARATSVVSRGLIDSVQRWAPSRATHQNTIYFVTSDATRPDGWAQLAKERRAAGLPPLNVVVSDGMHEPEALTFEMEQLSALGVLAKTGPFTMVWDDCLGSLRSIVERRLLPQLADWRSDLCYVHTLLPGWVGLNEPLHPTCIVTSLDMTPLLKRLETVLVTDLRVQSGAATSRHRVEGCHLEYLWPRWVRRGAGAAGSGAPKSAVMGAPESNVTCAIGLFDKEDQSWSMPSCASPDCALDRSRFAGPPRGGRATAAPTRAKCTPLGEYVGPRWWRTVKRVVG